MKSVIHRVTNANSYFEPIDNNKLKGKLPEEFSTADIPKSKPTDNPKYHLKNFRPTMIIKTVDTELYPLVFAISLDRICQNWLYSLHPKQTKTQESITIAFMMKQYGSNERMQTFLRELEILRQGENEGFTTYLIRWREKSVHMVLRPVEIKLGTKFFF